VEKYCGAKEATDNSVVHAHCVLDTEGYKHTHSEYVILNALPLQQWLEEHASMLHCMYNASLV
jgi:hypothetical protein